MSVSERSHGSHAIAEAHRRLEQIKERHKQAMFEDEGDYVTYEDGELVSAERSEDVIGIAVENRHRLIADICEEVQELFPEPEPFEVQRYRSLLLSMDMVLKEVDLALEPGDPLRAMENLALELRGEALELIEERLVLESPSDDEDAEVIYIYDPASKLRRTTALGGYREDYDKMRVDDQKKRFAEQVLYDPIPDTVLRP